MRTRIHPLFRTRIPHRFSHYVAGSGLLLAALSGCRTQAPVVQQPTAPVILELGNKRFSTDDFFQSFTKNQLSADSAQRTDLREYLDLYTNLKLKVLAAEQEGRDTTEAFREEMDTYRKQLAQSYLLDKVLIDQLATEAYQRMQEDVRASHLLLALSEDAAPADTLTTYRRALDLREQLRRGANFAQLAREHSDDRSVSQNGGDLGYFTAFQTVYPFESAAYHTPVGELSMPVRTKFGYHLIRVTDRRPSRGKVQVAHIMVRMSPAADASGQAAAKVKIDEAYQKLQRGDAFETVCRQYSDDVQSKANGGLLPVFAAGQMVPAFEEAAFALAKPGDISAPVRTNYGWHIIRLVERKAIEPYTELAPALRQKVTTDTRADVVRQATVQRLRREYAVRENEPVREATLAAADTTLLLGKWAVPEPLDASLQQKTLVTVGPNSFMPADFFQYVQRKQQPRPAVAPGRNPSARTAMRHLYDRFVGDQLVAAEEAGLERKYAEFRALLAEIRDGVLLSQVMEKNVWERSLADSTGQRRYYEANKDKYRYPERAVATVISAANDDVLRQTQQMLAGNPYQLRRSAPDLTYAKNQTTLTQPLRETLFEVLVALVKNPDYLVEVAGSHDAAERDTTSAGRIRHVVAYLTANGVPITRIMEKDHGAYRPASGSGARSDASAQRRITFQYFSSSKQDVAKVINGRTPASTTSDGPNVVIAEGTFTRGQHAQVDAVPWKPGSTTLRVNGRPVVVTIARLEPARPKTFDEARGAVINDYQAQLEQQWLAELKQKYPVKINDAEVRKLIK